VRAPYLILGGLIWAPFACDGGGAEQRAEVASVTVAIDRLRDAPNATKSGFLLVLRKTACTLPDACGLRDQCAAAYTDQVQALAEIMKLKQSGGAIASDPAQVAAIEQKLARARDGAKACVDGEAKLIDRYRVKSTQK
jgi:hypothetical protein